MTQSSPPLRILLAIGGVLVAAALALDIFSWSQGSAIAWARLGNQVGVLILMAAAAFGPTNARARNALTIVALVFIIPSAALIVWRAVH